MFDKTFGDICPLTCEACACPDKRLINCGDILSGAASALLGSCVGEDAYIEQTGYAPFVDCLQAATATCEPMSCVNLYYDVHDACEGSGTGCSSSACTDAMRILAANSDSCAGPQVLGNGMTLLAYHTYVKAKCLGCLADDVHQACDIASVDDTCSSSCADVSLPFYDNFETSLCDSLLSEVGLGAESDYVEMVHTACTKPCTGLLPPVDGLFGTCPSDGTLQAGTCNLACKSTFVKSGGQPRCYAGVLTESIVCSCAEGFFTNGPKCSRCTECAPGWIEATACGYDIEGRLRGDTDTQCSRCGAGTYSAPDNTCRMCSVCDVEQIEQSACTPGTDTLCADAAEAADAAAACQDDDAAAGTAQQCMGPT